MVDIALHGACENRIDELENLGYGSMKQTHCLDVLRPWNIGSIQLRSIVREQQPMIYQRKIIFSND